LLLECRSGARRSPPDLPMHDVTHYLHPGGTPLPAHECAGLRVLQEGAVLIDHEDTFIRKDGSFFPVVYRSSRWSRTASVFGLVVGVPRRDSTGTLQPR